MAYLKVLKAFISPSICQSVTGIQSIQKKIEQGILRKTPLKLKFL